MKMKAVCRIITLGACALAAVGSLIFLFGCAKGGLQKTTPLPGWSERSKTSYYLAPSLAGAIAGEEVLRNQGKQVERNEWRLSSVRDEEVWFISRGSTPEDSDEEPGSGTMVTKSAHGKKFVPLPLKHTDVRARVDGYIASVDVTQQFDNPYDSKIEAIYIFPLPHDSAVNEFVMIIGQRRVRGIIRDRAEAEKLYKQARRQGYVASLMTQERPNIFTQSVANIEPGKQIDVKISYFHTLPYVDGWYEFVFPMVVGPRYNPSGTTDGIGPAPRGARGASGQKTEIEYLRPDERSAHDISLKLELNPGVEIEETICRTHSISKEVQSPEREVISLARNDRVPNRDFVLRYRVAGDRLKSSLVTSRDERGGFFTLMLYPPRDLQNLPRNPLELVFVLDCSGSMHGRPLEQAKTAIRHALHQLQEEDTFQIIRFSNQASKMGARPIAATAANIRRGLDYVESLNSEGGTEMITGIKAALEFPHDPERLRFVCFLTDGYVGNESEILAAVQERIGESRIFSFGVGPAINRYLLEHMAKLGRGAVAYLNLKDNASEVMDRFFGRISHPAITDLRIDWAGDVREVYPKRIPDLFVGRPVVLTGRFGGKAPGAIHIRGRMQDERADLIVPKRSEAPEHNGIPSIWARLKMADLEDRALVQSDGDLPERVRELALDFGLLSAYTAFVAVDATHRTEGNSGTSVRQAVPAPKGVQYDTTVPE